MAINFTGSNGVPNLTNSLHYLGPNSINIKLELELVVIQLTSYGYVQKFPAFGLCGNIHGNHNTDHCFPLNCKLNVPVIFEQMELYKLIEVF